MENNIEQLVKTWITGKPDEIILQEDYYCETRDIFEARNDKTPDMLIKSGLDEDLAYLVYSIVGELGNNAFDHNLANWPDVPGLFFAVKFENGKGRVVLADRGLGVLNTLRNAVPNLQTDEEALELAFTKKISSRVLEDRGNGLKYVKNNVMNKNFLLKFNSGNAQVSINHSMKIEHVEDCTKGCLVVLFF